MLRLKKQGFESGIRKLNSTLSEVKKQRFELFRDYIEEVIAADEFNFARESYTSEVEMLDKKLKSLEKEYNQFKKILEPQEWIEKFKKYRSAKHLSKEMVEYFIDKIIVSKDNTINIKFKFTKEQLLGTEEMV